MDVRGIRKSSQNEADHGYNLDGREILNFGKYFYELSIVRAKNLPARVQLTIYTQADDGNDASDYISRGELFMDDGSMFG